MPPIAPRDEWTALPMPDPRIPLDANDRQVVPEVVARAPRLVRVDLPTPDGYVLVEHAGPQPVVVVMADPRISDGQVARLVQAAQLLAELIPEQRARIDGLG